METGKILGLVGVAIIAVIPIYNVVRAYYKDKRHDEREHEQRHYEQRERQIESAHQQTLATQELTHEMKTMRRDIISVEERTSQVERRTTTLEAEMDYVKSRV